ncbi:hypothetical protein [Shimazuella alba]|uniref:Uncharacterized protein n=1 Tax=Shimazuella alba TaxID=2690964 RepID=A0A6I4W5D4_9BACL|nr:hypothetical protein [Shimazuella alba]MXQ55984.1 hypothetical protein [Shimazuella alba]
MMKVIGIIFVIFLLSALTILLMDLRLGFNFTEAWHHLLNPFWVMSSAEYVMLGGLLLIVIVQQVTYRKKSMKNNGTT